MIERDATQADITPEARRRSLTLSEVDRGAGGRLTLTAARYVELNGVPRRPARYPVELVARLIADHDGDVWPAVVRFGISYEHALRIRRGWRPVR
jgi:hypothetical protein